MENPLTPSEVWTILHSYLGPCPASNPPLLLKTAPQLTAAFDAPTPVKAGGTMTLTLSTAAGVNRTLPTTAGTVTGAFVTFAGPVFFAVVSDGKGGWTGTVPATGVVGQSYAVLNDGALGVSEGSILAGPVVVEVAPAA